MKVALTRSPGAGGESSDGVRGVILGVKDARGCVLGTLLGACEGFDEKASAIASYSACDFSLLACGLVLSHENLPAACSASG